MAEKSRLAGLDEFIEQERAQWKVPGVALAVVQDGKVILSAGYGQRDVKNALPVTPQTVFPLASVTKSLTVATLAALVRQGRLDWDRPVREYLPDFRLWDPVATDRMTARDLVTHRSGLPRHDFAWYGATLSRRELYLRLRHLEPSKDFRSAYQYQNLMYMTAGHLAGELTGTTWEEAVRRTLFKPLGMSRTSTSIPDLRKEADAARPYKKDDAEQVNEVPYYEDAALGPAGSANSCVADLIRYVQMHLDGGRFRGKVVLSEQDVAQMQTPQMVIPDVSPFPELGHSQYGMGFVVTSYRGHKLVQHGGALPGFSTLLSFLPQDGLGVVALCNISGSSLPSVLMYQVYDRLLGLEPVAWSARLQELVAQGKAAEDTAKDRGLTPRKPDTRPSHALSDYPGLYKHPAYGAVEIKPDGEGLGIGFHGFTSPLHHFHYDVFETPPDKLNNLERRKVRFETDWSGEIASLQIAFEPQVADIVFARAADPALRDPAFLEAFAGDYTLGGRPLLIRLLEDGTLQALFPGQSPYALRPVRGTTFEVEGLSGHRIEFQKEDAGRVTGLALYQPSGNLLAERVSEAGSREG